MSSVVVVCAKRKGDVSVDVCGPVSSYLSSCYDGATVAAVKAPLAALAEARTAALADDPNEARKDACIRSDISISMMDSFINNPITIAFDLLILLKQLNNSPLFHNIELQHNTTQHNLVFFLIQITHLTWLQFWLLHQ